MRLSLIRRACASAALAALLLPLSAPPPADAQTELTITTPFPSVSVQPGGDVSFDLTVRTQEAATVDLAVEGAPDGWRATLEGGGNEVHSVFVDPAAPATVTLAVRVPDSLGQEPVTLTVVGTAGDERAELEVELVPAVEGGGSVSLESDYPSVRGTSDQDFSFTLTLRNDTPQELVFGLQATGPQGWEVSAQPSGESQAASVTVEARGEQRLDVDATPPPQATSGTYPLTVEAVAGEHRAAVELAVELTGSVEMTLTTPDSRLNTTATAGGNSDFTVLVVNEGTSPLTGVSLTSNAPSEWEVTFEPESLEEVPPGESREVIAHLTPSANAVAGDYVVGLTANVESARESIDVRVTVETSLVWGIVGVALIVATLGAMAWIFRRYGRR